MFPIEGYVNAYIHAISTEMRQSRADRHSARDTEGAIDRLSRTVARMLNVRPRGSHAPTRPLLAT
ncbi:MAG: hypothetical protein ABFS21_10495 [Actinomycetota bacterium]